MSDRQHFPNTLAYSQYRSPAARYGTGLALMLVVHAGAIVAIKNGLDVTKWLKPAEPPTYTSVMDPPAVKPQPVETFAPVIAQYKMTMPEAPTKPFIQDENPPPSRRDEPQPGGGSGAQASTGEPAVLAARSDPRHPLTQPAYPLASRKLGEQGSVQLLVFVLPNGRVGEAQVATSSGFERLDDAAVREALRSWRFLPNTVDGVAVGSWCRIGITFRLKD